MYFRLFRPRNANRVLALLVFCSALIAQPAVAGIVHQVLNVSKTFGFYTEDINVDPWPSKDEIVQFDFNPGFGINRRIDKVDVQLNLSFLNWNSVHAARFGDPAWATILNLGTISVIREDYIYQIDEWRILSALGQPNICENRCPEFDILQFAITDRIVESQPFSLEFDMFSTIDLLYGKYATASQRLTGSISVDYYFTDIALDPPSVKVPTAVSAPSTVGLFIIAFVMFGTGLIQRRGVKINRL